MSTTSRTKCGRLLPSGQWLGSKEHGRGVAVHWARGTGLWIYDGEFSHGVRSGWGMLQVRGKAGARGVPPTPSYNLNKKRFIRRSTTRNVFDHSQFVPLVVM
eukprot:1150186-Amphidinium_carterae.1